MPQPRLPRPADDSSSLDRRTLLARTGVIGGTALITSVVAPAWAAASPTDPNPDMFPPDPKPGVFTPFTTQRLSVYKVTIIGAAGGGGLGAVGLLPGAPDVPGGTGASGAKITADLTLLPGTTLEIYKGGGGSSGTHGGGGGTGSAGGGAGGSATAGGGGGGGASLLSVGGVDLIIAAGGGGGSTAPTATPGAGGKDVNTAIGNLDGGDGVSGGGGGGGGSTGGAGGTAATSAQGGTSYWAMNGVGGATLSNVQHFAGTAGATPADTDGAEGTITLAWVSSA